MPWTCYFNGSKYSFVESYDSFRIQPGIEIINYLKTSNKQITYRSTQVQNLNDMICGHLCLDYTKRRFKGLDPQNFI